MEVEGVGKVAGGYQKKETPVVEQESARVMQPKEVAVSEPKVSGGQKQEQKQNKERVVSEASINDAVSKANRNMDKVRCEYSYHKETNRVSIRVIDE
ncbi:MAG: flagellar protein FlaG, partial [Eubacterium sp.]|nr:flagellar protein FlaG [Eubacterium sp.]